MARVPNRTFYDVLGINRDANHDAIKLAYKKMSRRCHPDKNPGNGHAVAWQQEVNKAYETLRDAASRVAYDAKLPAPHRTLNPFAPRYTWNGFDGAWGAPAPAHWQPAGYYRPGQRTTADDYWGGTRARHESSPYDFNDSWEKKSPEKDQGWDFNNWHESQPSEPGSFSWTENEELWKKAEEERLKAEKEQEEIVDAERRKRRKKKRAERQKEQKRINDARIPAQQKKLSGKITALDEDIARLKAVSRRSTLASNTDDAFYTDGEATDTVDHLAIKLNRRRRALGEVLNMYHQLCRVQRSNGHADEAEDAERELAKAREDSAFRLAHEFAREEEEHSAGCASLHEEGLHMQSERHKSDQEKEQMPQEQYEWKDAASEDSKPNESRVTGEHSNADEPEPGERNVCELSPKLQEQADIGANPVPMQLRYRRIYEWLEQLPDNEEYEAPGGHTVKTSKHPDSPTPPIKAFRNPIVDNPETPTNQDPCSSPSQVCHSVCSKSEPEPLIPDLSPRSSSSQASSDCANEGPDPQIPPLNRDLSNPFGFPSTIDSKPGPNAEAFKLDNEIYISGYLQTVHKPHLEVHGEFWDFGADEVSCDFCHLLSPVLQCPKCNLRACSECKTNRGERSCDDMWEWR